MPTPLFVGIDVSSKDNVVCCLTNDDEKRPLSRFTVLNNRPGILDLQQRITQLVQKHNFDQVRFGLEHTGCYSTHAAMYLQRHLDFGYPDVKVYTCLTPASLRSLKNLTSWMLPKTTGWMPGSLPLSSGPAICPILLSGASL